MRVKELDLDLMPMMKRAEVRARQRVLSRILEGSWNRMIKGRGMEFAGFRRYTYGDDASMIDWNATLRTKETLVREFEEYKNINVFLLLDVSDSMLFSSRGKLKAEYGAELLFNLALAVLDNGEAVGFGLFAEDLIVKQQPGLGVGVVYKIATELQKPRNYGGRKNFAHTMRVLNDYLKQRSLIVLISDFIGYEEGWEQYIKMLSQKFDLIGIMLRDPRDRALPDIPLQAVVQDPYTKEKIYIDARKYRKEYGEEVKREEEYILSVFEKARANLILLETSRDPYPVLMDYFRRRNAIMKH